MKRILELFKVKAFPRFKRVLTCTVFNFSSTIRKRPKAWKVGRDGIEGIGIDEPPRSYFIVFSYGEESTKGKATQSSSSWTAQSPALPPFGYFLGVGWEGGRKGECGVCWFWPQRKKITPPVPWNPLSIFKQVLGQERSFTRSKCLENSIHIWEAPPTGILGSINLVHPQTSAAATSFCEVSEDSQQKAKFNWYPVLILVLWVFVKLGWTVCLLVSYLLWKNMSERHDETSIGGYSPGIEPNHGDTCGFFILCLLARYHFLDLLKFHC